MKNPTIRVPQANTLAPKEVERLFAGLELFANLGDSFQEYGDFATRCPTFCPVALQNASGQHLHLLPLESLHELVIVFRDYLGSVWRQHPATLREQILKILLGLAQKGVGNERWEGQDEEETEWEPLDPSTPERLAETERIRQRVRMNEANRELESASQKTFPNFDPPYRRALYQVMHDPQRRDFIPTWPLFIADWVRGEFSYQPANDFQRAVFTLFRQSWRARICRECQKLFIAAKHPQTFCSVRCSTAVKLRRNRAFWKNRGTPQRRKRNQERRRLRKKAKQHGDL
jgi:hypothetical protein